MTQNQIPVKGRVWFQSKYLAKTKLPLLQLSIEQQEILQTAKKYDHVNITNVNINSYPVDSEGTISDQIHHTKTLCTIYKSKYKKKDTIPIVEFLSDYNRKRLISYRIASREFTPFPNDHGAATDFRVIYARNTDVKKLEGRPPGINPLPDVSCPDIEQAHKSLSKTGRVYYNKVEFDKL